MLATLVAQPFDRAGWVYEEKYDSDRILAYNEGARVRLFSRNGKDNTDPFPTIAAAIEKFRCAFAVGRQGCAPAKRRSMAVAV